MVPVFDEALACDFYSLVRCDSEGRTNDKNRQYARLEKLLGGDAGVGGMIGSSQIVS